MDRHGEHLRGCAPAVVWFTKGIAKTRRSADIKGWWSGRRCMRLLQLTKASRGSQILTPFSHPASTAAMLPHALSVVAQGDSSIGAASPVVSAQQDMPAHGCTLKRSVQANPNIGEQVRGRTPLHAALARGAGLGVYLTAEADKPALVAALLRGGASALCRDCRGETPLAYALDGNDAGALAALLAHGGARRAWRAELSRELPRLFRRPCDGALWRRWVEGLGA